MSKASFFQIIFVFYDDFMLNHMGEVVSIFLDIRVFPG